MVVGPLMRDTSLPCRHRATSALCTSTRAPVQADGRRVMGGDRGSGHVVLCGLVVVQCNVPGQRLKPV